MAKILCWPLVSIPQNTTVWMFIPLCLRGGLKLDPALTLNQNPIFEMASIKIERFERCGCQYLYVTFEMLSIGSGFIVAVY